MLCQHWIRGNSTRLINVYTNNYLAAMSESAIISWRAFVPSRTARCWRIKPIYHGQLHRMALILRLVVDGSGLRRTWNWRNPDGESPAERELWSARCAVVHHGLRAPWIREV